MLTTFCITQGTYISNAWRDLFPELLTKYRDGYVMDPSGPTIQFTRMFYPKWWLDLTGYFDIGGTDGGILFQPNVPVNQFSYSIFGSIFLLLVGYAVGRWSTMSSSKSSGYVPVTVQADSAFKEISTRKTELNYQYQDVEMVSRD